MPTIPVNEPLLDGNEQKYVLDAVASGWISSAGSYITRFETEWAAYCGRRHGVAVSNGTVALELAVSALDLPAGSEVIIPAFTIVSCVEAVLRSGHVPVLVDADPRTYCLDAAQVRSRITPRTRAIMPVHIYGHPCEMEEVLAIAAEHGLKVVEDAAEAHGAECRVGGAWRRCGSFGDLSAFSFYANKNITTGEGGMVLTDDDALAAKLRSRRSLCFSADERFRHEDRGWNFRMTNLQAAIGCAQLERIDRFLARKREMAARYTSALAGLTLRTPHVEPWARSSVWMYAVLLDDSVPFGAVEFAKRLLAEGVETRPFFRGLHDQPAYPDLRAASGPMPVAEKIYARGLYLPSGQGITDGQVDAAAAAVRRVLG